ncbi:MAG: hypothetical protein K9M54_07970 [Kiritimatiellales bacterium]|nr:hypothetical protein [Kiritimatiellales bacterium]MCF7863923.1 hypothetical protein [Kiritimatiellales bacterium]
MTPREKLQYSYELAFHPPRLNGAWQRIKRGDAEENIKELLDTALLLHQALPENGFSSQRALQRLAQYQAKSRAFGMVAFLRNIRSVLGCGELDQHVVPGNLVRDIGLPTFCHPPK